MYSKSGDFSWDPAGMCNSQCICPLSWRKSTEPGATVGLCETFVPLKCQNLALTSPCSFGIWSISSWQKDVRWSRWSLSMLKHLVKTWWDRITAAFFHFTRRESFLRLHVPGRTSSSKREQFLLENERDFDGCLWHFWETSTCWKQNIWRFGRNKGFAPPQTSSKRSEPKMCVKDWGNRVCWTHCMVFDSNLPKTRHTFEFCCSFQSWSLRCATVHERIISHAVIVHVLSERMNHQKSPLDDLNHISVLKILELLIPFRDVYPSHYLNILMVSKMAQHWVSPQIFWIAWYPKSYVFQT